MRNGGSGMEDVEVRRLLPFPPSEHSADITRPGDPRSGREPKSTRRPGSARGRRAHGFYFAPCFDPIFTVSFLRPLRRRRFRVLRPPFDFMRARKPCLFFRFRFRGLYVGFMATTPGLRALLYRYESSMLRYPPLARSVKTDPNDPLDSDRPVPAVAGLTFPQSRGRFARPVSGDLRPGSCARPAIRRC